MYATKAFLKEELDYETRLPLAAYAWIFSFALDFESSYVGSLLLLKTNVSTSKCNSMCERAFMLVNKKFLQSQITLLN
jgi:hypothetical protein